MNIIKAASRFAKNTQVLGTRTRKTLLSGFTVLNATLEQEMAIGYKGCGTHPILFGEKFAYYANGEWLRDDVKRRLRPSDVKRRLALIGVRAKVLQDKIIVM